MFVFSFLTCFLLVFLSFCSDSSSSFLCVPFNSKSFLFWSPAAASVFSSASQRAAQTVAAFLSLFFISVFFLFLFKALTPQSAAAACQQTRLRPIPTAQRRPLNLKKRNVKSQRGKQTPPSLLSHFTCSSSQLKPPWAQVLQGKKSSAAPSDRSIDRTSHSDRILFSPHPPYNLTHSSSLHLKVTNCYAK